MADQDSLASLFEEQRAHLRGVAYRILGSVGDADDAVQDTWLRLSRSDVSDVANLGGWLTTVVARVALNMLQARKTRREEVGAAPPEDGAHRLRAGSPGPGPGPEDEALLGDSVGAALQVVLDTLEPRERIAFVLHDLFGVPFEEIAPVTGVSTAGARQLASRARRRVASAAGPVAAGHAARQARHSEIVAAFFAAAREARFGALLELLDPDVVMRADEAAARLGATAEVAGADAVARWLSGRAQAARLALVDGEPGAVWAAGGKVRVAFWFTFTPDERIARIDVLGAPEVLGGLDIEVANVPR
jgi:RNA polymerase sigma factor (sigma-70 family)